MEGKGISFHNYLRDIPAMPFSSSCFSRGIMTWKNHREHGIGEEGVSS